MIVQPENKETAPGLLLSLLHLEARYGDATVVVFPSDHHIAKDGLFMGYVDLALRLIEQVPSRVVLLGVLPDAPESEYGYVVPGPSARGARLPGLRRVAAFVEKPDAARAAELIDHGGLWNSMVMTCRVSHLLALIQRLLPDLTRAFTPIRSVLGTADEEAVVDAVYREIPVVNFSRAILAALPMHRSTSLLVLPMRGVSWSDCGSEQRVTRVFDRLGATVPALAEPTVQIA